MALIADGYYIPLGFSMDDLPKLDMAKAAPILEDSSLHVRMMAGEVLALKARLMRDSNLIDSTQVRLETIEVQQHPH